MKRYFPSLAASAALSLITLAPVSAFAQAGVVRHGPIPTARTILEKYVAATGGKEAYAKVKTMVFKSETTITAQNITVTGIVYAKSPSKYYTVQTVPGIGEIKQGFDGNEGWSQDPFSGLRSLSGVEKVQLKQEALANSPLEWRRLFKSADVLGIRKVEGKDAYVVRFTPALGKPRTQYFDTTTFLLVREDAIAESPQGTNPVESYPSDYRTVNGLKMAFRVRALQGANEIVTKVTDLQINVPVDDKLFVKPTAP